MPLLTKDTAIFFLKHNALEVYFPANAPVKVITFPSLALQYQEIIDRTVFDKCLTEFLKPLNIREAIIVLSSEIIYGTMIASNTTDIQQNILKKFFEQIPFDQEKIAKKIIVTKGVICMGTNKEYYNLIKSNAEQLNTKIKAILPAPLFSQQEQNVTELIKSINKQSLLAEQCNFLTQNKQELSVLNNELKDSASVKQENKNVSNKKQYILLVICLCILVSAILFVLLQQGIIFKTAK